MSSNETREDILARFGIDSPIKIAEHGHLFVVDLMGGDESIENAARLSYKSRRKRSDTRSLIRYLLRHNHTTPFEKAVISVNMRLPIFVARQLVRYRHQSINEVSGRYSVLPEEFFVPTPEEVRYQDKKNKQGGAESFPKDEAEALAAQLRQEGEESFVTYRQLHSAGVSLELSRINLPLSTYTEWDTTINVLSLMHMVEQRVDTHAQEQTRPYAQALLKIFEAWCPIASEAFRDYRLEAMRLSRAEVGALGTFMSMDATFRRILIADPDRMRSVISHMSDELSGRELDEFLRKIHRITGESK